MIIMSYLGTLNLNSLSGEVVVAKNDSDSLKLAGHEVFQYDLSNFDKGLMNKLLKPVRLFIFPYEIFYIRKKIKDIAPDIIHLHTITPYISISLLIYLSILNIPVVQTLHNVRWVCAEGAYYRGGVYCNKCSGNNGFWGVIHRCNKNVVRSLLLFLINRIYMYNRFIFKCIKCFIPVSNFIRNEFRNNGFPPEKMIVKSNENLGCVERALSSAHDFFGSDFLHEAGRLTEAWSTPGERVKAHIRNEQSR